MVNGASSLQPVPRAGRIVDARLTEAPAVVMAFFTDENSRILPITYNDRAGTDLVGGFQAERVCYGAVNHSGVANQSTPLSTPGMIP
jgi:hypothetical protein